MYSLDSEIELHDSLMFGEKELPGGSLEIDKIGFFNVGYWKGVEDSIELAQINLMERLLNCFPKRSGNVLDVACGKGGSSKFLTKYFIPKNITGINISERQLQVCKTIAPECCFRLMNATKLDFSDSSFDNVLCIESAHHFMTRVDFLKEAYRVLKPYGRLALDDILDMHDADKCAYPENRVQSLEAYREDLIKIGFRYVRVEDITELTVIPYLNHRIRTMEKQANDEQDLRNLELLRTYLETQTKAEKRPVSYSLTLAIK